MRLQVLMVRRRLLASIHADVIADSIRVHGWDRTDVECALAVAGSWQRLEEMFKDFQRRGIKVPYRGPELGRHFYGFVLCGGVVDANHR